MFTLFFGFSGLWATYLTRKLAQLSTVVIQFSTWKIQLNWVIFHSRKQLVNPKSLIFSATNSEKNNSKLLKSRLLFMGHFESIWLIFQAIFRSLKGSKKGQKMALKGPKMAKKGLRMPENECKIFHCALQNNVFSFKYNFLSYPNNLFTFFFAGGTPGKVHKTCLL